LFKPKATDILKTNKGHINFFTGILAKESGGSQVYYLKDLDIENATIEKIKSEISK